MNLIQIDDVIIEKNVPWMDTNQFIHFDIFIAIALTSIVLQLTSIYHGYMNLKRDKDRDWKIVWGLFIFGMFGIVVRRVWSFTILLETCDVSSYYRLLIESLFQLFLSVVYIVFAMRFHRLKVKILPTGKELPNG